MVQVLPQKTNLGSQIGQSLGMGLQQSMSQAANQQYQKGQLQQALGGLKELANDPSATPFDVASSLISATSHIPGAERYVGQLYDSLMRSKQTQNYFGGNQTQPGGMSTQGNMNPPQQGNSPQGMAPGMGQGMQQGAPQQQMQPGGIGAQGSMNPLMGGPQRQLSPLAPNEPSTPQGTVPQLNVMTPEQMHQEATRRAVALNDPSAYPNELANLEALNDAKRKQQQDVVQTQALESKRQQDVLQRDTNLRTFAQDKVKGLNDPEELNDFMILGQRHEDLKNNPSLWLDATRKDFDKFMNNKTALETAVNPGLFRSIIRGGKDRQQALKRLDPMINNLISLGKEDYVRKKLKSMDLSPTEVEERIHPLPQETKSNIEKLPRAPYESNIDEMKSPLPLGIGGVAPWDFSKTKQAITGKREGKDLKSYDEIMDENPKLIDQSNNKLADFIRSNISNSSSLLVLRDNLVNKKGYDWRQFNDALEIAEKSGLELTPRQNDERSELTRAPLQSLPDIFSESFRWVDYLRGNK